MKKSEVMARQCQVIAVVIKQYGTGLYRACVSLERDDVTFLSTHKDERSANETINLFWRAYDDGRLKTPEDVAAFIKFIQRKNVLAADNHPVPPPLPPMPPLPPAPALPAAPPMPSLPQLPPRPPMAPISALPPAAAV